MSEAIEIPTATVESIDPALEAKACLAFCDRHQIQYQRFTHPAAHTVEDAKQHSLGIPGEHCKNLFLKSKKNHYWVVTIPAEAMISLAALADALGCTRLSMGNPVRMAELLHVKPGAVTPLAVINDHQQKVRCVVDERLKSAEFINFPPLDNTQTLQMLLPEFIRYMDIAGHPVRWQSTETE